MAFIVECSLTNWSGPQLPVDEIAGMMFMES